MSLSRVASSRPYAVLSMSLTEVEWLDYDSEGNARYARLSVEGEGAASLVRAAVAARAQAGGARGPVTLALREGLVAHRLLEVPLLSKRDLTKVFARKAAALFENSECPPLFSCIEHAKVEGEASSRWSIAAMDRPLVRKVVLGLRKAGMPAKSITSEELAALNCAREHEVEEGTATISVSIGPTSVQVSLICGDDLYTVETLSGDLGATPHLIASLLQSVKTSGGYWRRTQRGSRVRGIVIMGLAAERAELLGNALRLALPEARVVSSPSTIAPAESESPIEPTPDQGRIMSLETCLMSGPFTPKLQFPIPARRRSLVVGAALAAVVAFMTVGIVTTQVGTRVATLEKHIDENRRVTEELAVLERSRTQSIGQLTSVTRSLDRTDELMQSGVEYESVMRNVLTVLAGRASILNLEVGPESDGVRNLSFRAVATGGVVGAIQDIGNLERELEQVLGIHDVRVDLPSSVKGSNDQLDLEFGIRSKLEANS